jgi:YVTN family beta-propeller protein
MAPSVDVVASSIHLQRMSCRVRPWMTGLAVLLLGCGSSPPDDSNPRDAGRDSDSGSGGSDGSAAGTAGEVGSGGIAGGDAPVVDDGGVATDTPDVASDTGTMPLPPCVASVCGTALAIDPKNLVYDASRARLYVSIQGGAARYPNTITVIDPNTMAVTASIPVGSDPRALALSDDSSTLWVGLDGSYSMRKVMLTASPPVVGPLRMVPPSEQTAAVFVNSLVPMSDSAATVAGLLTNSPVPLAVYDDGIVRGSMPIPRSLPGSITKGPPGMFLGVDDMAVYLLAVSATGITQTVFPGLVSRTGAGLFYADERLHAGNVVVDMADRTAPRRLGAFAFNGTIAPHSRNRVIMLSPPPFSLQGDSQWELRLLETDTFTQRGSVKIPTSLLGTGTDNDYVHDLYYLGGDALVLIARRSQTDASRVLLLRAPLLANDGVGAGGSDGGSGGAGADAGTGDAGGGTNPGAICAGCTLQKIDVPGFRMVHDRTRSRLYAVSTYDAAHDPNTLTSIDATTGNVLAKVPIDTYPRQMAMSDDGATLWVGFDMADSIRKFSVSNTPPVPGAAYPLPPSTSASDRTTAYDLVALPGSPTSIAACISGGTNSRIAILDDGVARPMIDASRLFVSKLASGPPGMLFGYNGVSSGYDFATYTIGPQGVTLQATRQGLMGVYQNDIHYHQGRVYADQGEVIDVSDPARPIRAGKFAFAGLITAGSSDRMLMLTAGRSQGHLQLRILETGNFTQVASLSLGTSFRDSSSAAELVYLGGDGVAFLSPANDGTKDVFIFRSPMIAAAP